MAAKQLESGSITVIERGKSVRMNYVTLTNVQRPICEQMLVPKALKKPVEEGEWVLRRT